MFNRDTINYSFNLSFKESRLPFKKYTLNYKVRVNVYAISNVDGILFNVKLGKKDIAAKNNLLQNFVINIDLGEGYYK